MKVQGYSNLSEPYVTIPRIPEEHIKMDQATEVIAGQDKEIKRLRKLLSMEAVKCCETCQHHGVELFEDEEDERE